MRFVTESEALLLESWREARQAVDKLSEREREILILCAKGYSYVEIAELLHRSVFSIRDSAKHLYARLDVHTGNEASVLAAKAGLV